MASIFHKGSDRGYAKHGWLETHHSFSFASYFDPNKMGFGALRVINDDVVAPGEGFGRHPHSNMEIITIPLSGALAHQDSMGNQAVIETGEIQVMSAGTGVEHAEFNASQKEAVSLLQIWIMPHTSEVAPRYDQKKFDPSEFTNKLSVVVGEIGQAPLGIHQSAKISLGRFDQDTEITYELSSSKHGVYWFVIDGEVEVDGQVLEKRDALGVWEVEKTEIQVKAGTYLLGLEVPMRA